MGWDYFVGSTVVKNKAKGLERWSSSLEYLLLLLRTYIQFPVPTWELTTAQTPVLVHKHQEHT